MWDSFVNVALRTVLLLGVCVVASDFTLVFLVDRDVAAVIVDYPLHGRPGLNGALTAALMCVVMFLVSVLWQWMSAWMRAWTGDIS